MKFIQRLVRKAGFSQEVASIAPADLRCSTAAFYQSKWPQFFDWCGRWGVDPCNASIPVIAEFFLHLRQDLGFSLTAVKGYRAALLHVFRLTGMDLAASSIASRMFRLFGRSYPLHEIRPPYWNLSLVLRCISRSPFELLKLASDKI